MKNFPSIKKNEDFRFIYRKGKSYADENLVLYVIKNHKDNEEIHSNRIGISTSKKLGNSIVRHRMTRLIREAFRLNNEMLIQGYDLVVVARTGSGNKSYFDIEESFMSLCKRHGITEINVNE